MLEMIFNDVLNVSRSTFLNGDWIGMLIAFASVLVAAFVMRRGTQIGSMTLLALTLFALGGYLRGVFSAESESTLSGGRLAEQLEMSWLSFMGMTAANLLAYFLAFMVLILVLFGAKALFSRG